MFTWTPDLGIKNRWPISIGGRRWKRPTVWGAAPFLNNAQAADAERPTPAADGQTVLEIRFRCDVQRLPAFSVTQFNMLKKQILFLSQNITLQIATAAFFFSHGFN
ncbi:hypothetical protein [Desulfosarcina cetonica]|uniref:hypothetical protein n=1 Tax=Desulfosarcina cetonica TaxID=90730 RepID=UPI0012ECF415|nr:hypothetical protein [Desulfosarcina cetonica]